MKTESYQFHSSKQKTGEPISDSTCQFGTFLNQALRDKFVVAYQMRAYPKKVMLSNDMLLYNAIKVAWDMELATKDVGRIKSVNTSKVYDANFKIGGKKKKKKLNSVHKNLENVVFAAMHNIFKQCLLKEELFFKSM